MSAFHDIPAATVSLARAGDTVALARVYEVYERPVFALACRLVPQRAAAEELAHDVFVDVLTRLHQYDGRGSFAGWVRSITVSRCLMHLRSPWQRGRRWLDRLTDESGDGAQRIVNELAAPGSDRGDQIDLERALAPAWRYRTSRRVAARRRGLHARRNRCALRRDTELFQIPAGARARAVARLAGTHGSRGVMHARIEQLLSLRDGEPVDVAVRRTRRQRVRSAPNRWPRWVQCANGSGRCASHLEFAATLPPSTRALRRREAANRSQRTLTRGSLAASVAIIAIATAWRLYEPAAPVAALDVAGAARCTAGPRRGPARAVALAIGGARRVAGRASASILHRARRHGAADRHDRGAGAVARSPDPAEWR